MSVNIATNTASTQVVALEAVTANSVNRQTYNSGGVYDTLLLLSGQREILTGNSNQTVTANFDVCFICNNTIDIFIDFPAASTQQINKNIRVIKVGNNTAKVTIRRVGSDTIGNPYSLISVPVDTSFDIFAPGESYEWNATGNVWYCKDYNLPLSQVSFRAGLTGSTAIPTTPAKLAFNTVTGTNRYNRGGYFDTTNNRFLAPFPMVMNFTFSVALSAQLADTAGNIRVNGNAVEVLGGRHNLNTPLDMACSSTVELTTGDQVEGWVNSSPARTAVAAGTVFAGQMISRL